MKTSVLSMIGIIVVFTVIQVSSQSVISPESVVFDDLTGDYYISCTSAHNILKRDFAGNLTVFQPSSPTLSSPKGMCIAGNVLYVTDEIYIRGFTLDSGLMVMNLMVPGAVSLNDITTDPAGTNLYISDMQENKIFRVSIASQITDIWITSGVIAPNGLFYDALYNRMMVVEFSTFGTIKSINLSSLAISTVVPNTAGMLDGIGRDSQGFWYVSSWATHKVYRYHPSLVGTPQEVTVSAGALNGPADLMVNTSQTPNILAIPSMNNNQVYFIPLSWTQNPSASDTPDGGFLYPTPADDRVTLLFTLLSTSSADLQITDMTGRNFLSQTIQSQSGGRQQINLDTSAFPPGLYTVSISSDKTFWSQSLLIK